MPTQSDTVPMTGTQIIDLLNRVLRQSRQPTYKQVEALVELASSAIYSAAKQIHDLKQRVEQLEAERDVRRMGHL